MNALTIVPGDIGAALERAGVTITARGLCIGEPLEFEEWCKVGSLLNHIYDQAQTILRFAIGDWYNYGLKWGEKADGVVAAFPEGKYHTIRKYAYVAAHYSQPYRVQGWTWNMYRELAPESELTRLALLALPPAEAREKITFLKERRSPQNLPQPAWTPEFLGGGKTLTEVEETLRQALTPHLWTVLKPETMEAIIAKLLYDTEEENA